MSRAAEAAVITSAPVTFAYGGALNTAISLTVGLMGVILARTVFVDRENRRQHRKQTLRETLPLTFIAMLVAAVVIIDNNFSYSKSAFIGLGVGWVAVLLLDIIGERILNLFSPTQVKLTDMTGLTKLPHEMTDDLHLIDLSMKAFDKKDIDSELPPG